MRSLINNATIRNVFGFRQDAAIARAVDTCYGMRAPFYHRALHSGCALSAAALAALADGWRRTLGRLLLATERLSAAILPASATATSTATGSNALAGAIMAMPGLQNSVAMKRRQPVAVRRIRRLAVR